MIVRFLIICYVFTFPITIQALRRRCNNTGVLFTDKIFGSPIIVYGESIRKAIYLETETELLFNVTFRVDCILKGAKLEHQIEITSAGIKEGRNACQWLDPGYSYVVFLEKCQSNMTLYCPFDYQERVVDEMTHELLQRTCHLTGIPPLHSTTNNCPNVSMPESCPNEEGEMKIIPKSKHIDDDDHNINMRTSFNNINQFHLQSNSTSSRSIVGQIVDNPNNHNRLTPLNSIWIILLIICIYN
ncbi:hypothetical protein I4U23_025361 [Adineta vaga]|nr:hypothetical protein I4U23_025361 [Adineta vaga]